MTLLATTSTTSAATVRQLHVFSKCHPIPVPPVRDDYGWDASPGWVTTHIYLANGWFLQ